MYLIAVGLMFEVVFGVVLGLSVFVVVGWLDWFAGAVFYCAIWLWLLLRICGCVVSWCGRVDLSLRISLVGGFDWCYDGFCFWCLPCAIWCFWWLLSFDV